MPDEPEVHGLLALMRVNNARRDARFAEGEVVLLRDQDRSLWDLEQIETAKAGVDRALALGGRGPYVLQAAIAVLHTEDPQDWEQIAALYGKLGRLTGSPVVELTGGRPRRGGDPTAALRSSISSSWIAPPPDSTRAELLRRLDRTGEARAEYGRALELVHTDAERRFLERRLADLPGR
jgi:RNA polymerase sigma-70 factor (ECF subfamily)